MKKIVFLISILTLLLTILNPLYSQEWSRIYRGLNPNGEDKPSEMAIDSQGDIYIAGFETGIHDADFCLIKYDTDGDTVWTQVYNGTGNSEDKAYAIVIDDLDNIYITGYATSKAGNKDIVIIKYNSAGIQLWVSTYTAPTNGDDVANAIKLDNSNNLYVGGYTTSVSSGKDYITLKYNVLNGNLIWVKTFNGTGNSTDIINALVVDQENNVIVTGNSMGTSLAGSEEIVTIKYSVNGVTMWIKIYDGNAVPNTPDKAYAITIDNYNDVYIAGIYTPRETSNNGIITIKYDKNGNYKWALAPVVDSSFSDFPTNIICTHDNNVLVSGTRKHINQPGQEDFITHDIHSGNGNLKWCNIYNSPYNSTDIVCAMALSETCNSVYVSGYSYRGMQSNVIDIVTLKYKIANGDIQDSSRYNNAGISKNRPVSMVVDNGGDVFITGWAVSNLVSSLSVSVIEDSNSDILTIKYSTQSFGNHNPPSDNNNFAKSNKLYQNFPNPFNPSTIIKFNLTNSAYVSLKVYDMLGRETAVLINDNLEAGEHSSQFNSGNLSSGIYLYELNVNGVKDIKKMILLK
jgi:hypothetical protein